ncbi:MAG TPA: FtsX-like permease family protein [Chitinophagales bacterium]|nr:FtsX-like permease family protein [Chitinophagales bacterium]
MNLSLLIAKRYLFSKKKTNAVNIISGVSAMAIGVGAMSLVLVLSVFNGLEGLVKSLYTVFYPEVLIVPKQAKTFEITDDIETILKSNSNIAVFSYTLEENALLEYNGQQYISTIKGIDDNYFKVVENFDKYIKEGTKNIKVNGTEFAILGAGIAYYLNINTAESIEPIGIYMPKKTAKSLSNVENAFQKRYINSCGMFAISDEFDVKYSIVPLDFFQELTEDYSQASKIEIKLKDNKKDKLTIKELSKKLGDNFTLKTRYEQNEVLYKVLQTEKWIVFAILSAILIIASFNIIGALSMLILDKRKDMAVLTALGYSKENTHKLFLVEGMLLSLLGASIGIIIGIILLLIQKYIGIIPMPGNTFVVEFYPVDIHILDIITVFILVAIISFIATWFPAKKAAENIEKEYLAYLN